MFFYQYNINPVLYKFEYLIADKVSSIIILVFRFSRLYPYTLKSYYSGREIAPNKVMRLCVML